MKAKKVLCSIAAVIAVFLGVVFALTAAFAAVGELMTLPASISDAFQSMKTVIERYQQFLFGSYWAVVGVCLLLPAVLLFVSGGLLFKKKGYLVGGNVVGFISFAIALAILFFSRTLWFVGEQKYVVLGVLGGLPAVAELLLLVCFFIKVKPRQVAASTEQPEKSQEIAPTEQPEKPSEIHSETKPNEQIAEQAEVVAAETVAPTAVETEQIEETAQKPVAVRQVPRKTRAAREKVEQPQETPVEEQQPQVKKMDDETQFRVIKPLKQPDKEDDRVVDYTPSESLSVEQVVDKTYGGSPNFDGDKLKYVDDQTMKQLERVKHLYDMGAITENEYTALILSFLSGKRK